MGVQFLLLLGLGSHSRQTSDEGDLISDVSFAHPSDLSLANHVHDFVSLQRSPCRLKGKEAHPRLDEPFDEAMILLDQVLQVFDLPQFDRFGKHPLALSSAIALGEAAFFSTFITPGANVGG